MAFELQQFTDGTKTAAGDYNDAADQYCLYRTTGSNFTLQTTVGGVVYGVLQDRPSSGTPGTLCILGVTKARCVNATHTAIAVGDKLRCSSAGGIMPSTANVGYYVIGRALEALGANTTGIITIKFAPEGAGSSGVPSGA